MSPPNPPGNSTVRPLTVRILGCSGTIAKGCRTTSFLLGERILVDAGTGVGDLTLEQMRCIDHVFLSHSHMDHICALPLLLDAVGSSRSQPIQVHGLAHTLQALRDHVFNQVIWPDFTCIPSVQAPFVQLQPIDVGDTLVVAGVALEVLQARHSVPGVGYAARGASGWWVYSGDTEGQTPGFWQRVNALQAADGVAALVIETAFSSREQTLADLSQHLTPVTLARELANLPADSNIPIYITHAKPHESQHIMQELQALEGSAMRLIDLQEVSSLTI